MKGGRALTHPFWEVDKRHQTPSARPMEMRRWYLDAGGLVECQYPVPDKHEAAHLDPIPVRSVNYEFLTFEQVKGIWETCAREKRCVRDVALEVIGEDNFTKAELKRQKDSRKVFVAPSAHHYSPTLSYA